MSEHELLPYYLRELTALRELGKRFGTEYPQVAEHLQFESGYGQNPQLAQLIEALAFLNARVSHQLDQDYPQLINALISILYPHLSAPMPAMGIAQWAAVKSLEKSIVIPWGTLLETDPNAGNSCRFSTCYDVKLHPIEVTEAKLTSDLSRSVANRQKSAQAVIELTLSSLHPKLLLSNLDLSTVEFYLAGDHGLAYSLHEILLRHCCEIVILEHHATKIKTHWRTQNCVKGLGFAPEQAILPQDPRTLAGQRWLAEFFALPEKFLFIQFNDLPVLEVGCERLEIHFYLNHKPEALLNKITPSQFQLGCTPIVNLFPKTTEPVEINHQQSEYRIITDIRKPQDYEIYNIQRVYSIGDHDTLYDYQPLFLPKEQSKAYWQSRRVACSQLVECPYPGTELFLRIMSQDNDFTPDSLVVETLCSNRHLPQLLQQQSPLPALQPISGKLPPLPIGWKLGVTQPRPALLQLSNHFLLLLHVIPNLLSYTTDQAQQLKQLLHIYLQPQQQPLRKLIDSIKDLKSESMAALIQQAGQFGYCRGTKLNLQLTQLPTESGSWLFFNVLEHFLGEQAPMNSFIQLCLTAPTEELYRWPIQTGNRPLL